MPVNTSAYRSWGRYPDAPPADAIPVRWRDNLPALDRPDTTMLPYGYGRSYGDSCLNEGGTLLDTRPLNRFLAFDDVAGVLRCEAGVSLAEILAVIVPRGWFLPVSPGTKFVSVAGAIANDIHGKNHHDAGTFGCHVTQFELVRSDGTRRICSPDTDADLFRATIGGLGLTGLITWAEFRLKPIANAYIAEELIRFESLDEFLALTAESDADYEYTVSWADCLGAGAGIVRGQFMRGNHDTFKARAAYPPKTGGSVRFPLDIPGSLINRKTVRAFNTLYYWRQLPKRIVRVVPYGPFFYPLDAILEWNRGYGPQGFFQYQLVVPLTDRNAAIKEVFRRIRAAGEGSPVVVLKTFGTRQSPGLMSFPAPGITLAMDFANHGAKTLDLLESLDAVCRDAGGRVYPAKDARMSAASFQAYFPQWREFAAYVDPHFSSSFWRRVTANAGEGAA